jgi:hypothetical protein
MAFDGHWQLGGLPTMPAGHLGRSLQILAAVSQICPEAQVQLGGVPIVVAGQGS